MPLLLYFSALLSKSHVPLLKLVVVTLTRLNLVPMFASLQDPEHQVQFCLPSHLCILLFPSLQSCFTHLLNNICSLLASTRKSIYKTCILIPFIITSNILVSSSQVFSVQNGICKKFNQSMVIKYDSIIATSRCTMRMQLKSNLSKTLFKKKVKCTILPTLGCTQGIGELFQWKNNFPSCKALLHGLRYQGAISVEPKNFQLWLVCFEN